MSKQVWLPVLIPTDKLVLDPENTQKQDKHTFSELRKNIRDYGMDENILATPIEGTDTYMVRSGNHRLKAAIAEGLEEIPCVIRDDWDENIATMQSVRRNLVRGGIDKESFTQVIDVLRDNAMDMDDIVHGMGFRDVEDLSLYYDKKEDVVDRVLREETAPASAHAAKMSEELGLVLQCLMEEYGETVPNSFMIFPFGGKKHVMCATSNALKRTLSDVLSKTVEKGMDLNVVLTGLLKIGLSHTNFLDGRVESEVESATVDPEDKDID